ncbi:MAG: hypothetical protein WDM81_19745 [Rhizomicrobium sp.]
MFVGRRIDQTVEGWQMPQGGIDDGGNARTGGPARTQGRDRHRQGQAARGEGRLAVLRPAAHLVGVALHGRYRGQRQKWLAMRFLGEDGDIDVKTPEP